MSGCDLMLLLHVIITAILLVIGDQGFKATPEGRLLLRNIAMIFDEYLQVAENTPRFSRVI